MDNDLLNISLKQGTQFNNYQNKIKNSVNKRENKNSYNDYDYSKTILKNNDMKIESMKNLTNSPNINDLSGMLSDSDLRVLKENYGYIMWSVLAVGILTITINIIKK